VDFQAHPGKDLRRPSLKQWMKKLVQQFDVEWGDQDSVKKDPPQISEERATLLYLLDTYNKHLFEIDTQPIRRVRETLDGFARELVKPDTEETTKMLFKLRQFFSSYRIDEYSYIQKTFEDFKAIIWDFADHLGEDMTEEKNQDAQAQARLEGLREAVESNSIEELRAKSRDFINFYIGEQLKKDERRSKRLTSVRKNLNNVKKQLTEANHTMRVDHLTGAYNRKSFDEQLKNHARMFEFSRTPVSLIILDIDHFKKVNDTYGHDVGDFVIKECVRMMKEVFSRDVDFVARIGGEEFAIILPDMSFEEAANHCEKAMAMVRKEVIVQAGNEIRFTVSMGLAQIVETEPVEQWIKRADSALYESKSSGRNRLSIAAPHKIVKAA
jgi:diguanylate cyclase (GGDEF)-like protein